MEPSSSTDIEYQPLDEEVGKKPASASAGASNGPAGPSPLDTANPISRWLFFWISNLLSLGFSRILEAEDIPAVPEDDTCGNSHVRFSQLHLTEKKSVLNAVIRLSPADLFWGLLWTILFFGCYLVGPAFILPALIRFLQDVDNTPAWHGWLLVMGLLLCAMIQAISYPFLFLSIRSTLTWYHQSWWWGLRLGIRARGALYLASYKKILRLASASSSVGEIINIQSSDGARIVEAFRFLYLVIFTPVVLILDTWLIYKEIGWAGVIGVGVLIAFFAFQTWVGGRIAKLREEVVAVTDERIRVMSDVLGAIKLVKLYVWEKPFSQKVRKIRSLETKMYRRRIVVDKLNHAVSLAAIALVYFLALSLAVVAFGTRLTVSSALTALALFNLLSYPLEVGSIGVKFVAEAFIATKRFAKILDSQEVTERIFVGPAKINAKSDAYIKIVDAAFQWKPLTLEEKQQQQEKENAAAAAKAAPLSAQSDMNAPLLSEAASDGTDQPTLRKVNLNISTPQLVAIVGRVGCGKSSILQAVLGDIPRVAGHLDTNGKIAYAPQSAWLVNDTLRNNITFGQGYDDQRYWQVLKACELVTDLRQLPYGDLTEIGEKGVNLSGGQKQRISLARAVYADADLVLLDDCLSAVDQYVGRQIFDNCIKTLLKGKIVLFVTNQLQYLSECDSIVVVRDGEISATGTFDDLNAKSPYFSQLVKNYQMERKSEESDGYAVEKKGKIAESEIDSIVAGEAAAAAASAAKAITEDGNLDPAIGRLIEDEDRQTGGVGWTTYVEYFRAGGVGSWLILAVLFLTAQGSKVASDWFVTYYIDIAARLPDTPAGYYLGVWSLLLLIFFGLLVARGIFTAIVALRASTQLHNALFDRVIRGTMRFFDQTPLGRLLNRFSKDLDQIDSLLPEAMQFALHGILASISIVVLIAIVFPWVLLTLLPLGAGFYFSVRYYRRSSRELRRLDGILTSPVYAHLSASLSGISVIRAYRAQERFESDYVSRVDKATSAVLAFEAANRWIGTRLDLISGGIVSVTALLIVIFRSSIPPAYAGLALAYALQMAATFQYAIRVTLDAENHMTSVERLVAWRDNLPVEAKAVEPSYRPEAYWPADGAISFENVVAHYSKNLPAVLKNVSISIKPHEKIGIVGRTGSGKSTLASVLFRLMELESGKIEIDGMDIGRLGLDDLRQHLTIIPQDTVLFVGNIRSNLDPFNHHSDVSLWQALEKVEMDKVVRDLPDQLQAQVDEGGTNLSLGQRQLLCIARAILKSTRILVLDEATASIDIESDHIIQRAIREHFNHCTVLTITHRLHTIIDCDRILVMDAGKVAEFGTPKELILRNDSLFSQLVAKTDEKTANLLRAVALGERKMKF